MEMGASTYSNSTSAVTEHLDVLPLSAHITGLWYSALVRRVGALRLDRKQRRLLMVPYTIVDLTSASDVKLRFDQRCSLLLRIQSGSQRTRERFASTNVRLHFPSARHQQHSPQGATATHLE